VTIGFLSLPTVYRDRRLAGSGEFLSLLSLRKRHSALSQKSKVRRAAHRHGDFTVAYESL